MGELIIRFDDSARADRWHEASGFGDEIVTNQPGDEPGFFDGKNSELPDAADSLAWYRRSLGEVPKYTAEQEVTLAKRMEAGKFADQLLEICDKQRSHEEREETTVLLRTLHQAEQLPVAVYDELYGAPQTGGKESFEVMMHRLVGAADEPHKRRVLERATRAGVQAREQLVHSILPLVVHIVKHDYWGDLPLSDMELVACGNVGAVRAVDGFDYTKGAKLGATAAKFWIHKEIKAGIIEAKRQQNLRGTTAEQERADKVDQARRAIEDSSAASGAATATALAKATGIKEAWVWDALDSSQRPASVEALLNSTNSIADGRTSSLEDYVIRRMTFSEDEPQAAADIKLLFGILNPGEREVVRRMLGFEGAYDSLAEVAAELGIHKNTAQSRYRGGIQKLRARSPEFLTGLAKKLHVTLRSTEDANNRGQGVA